MESAEKINDSLRISLMLATLVRISSRARNALDDGFSQSDGNSQVGNNNEVVRADRMGTSFTGVDPRLYRLW